MVVVLVTCDVSCMSCQRCPPTATVDLQSREKVLVCGLVKFVPAVAYHFCLNLPGTFSQPRTKTFSQLCMLKNSDKGGGGPKTQNFCGRPLCMVPKSTVAVGGHR